jgi:hypothetical protein
MTAPTSLSAAPQRASSWLPSGSTLSIAASGGLHCLRVDVDPERFVEVPLDLVVDHERGPRALLLLFANAWAASTSSRRAGLEEVRR